MVHGAIVIKKEEAELGTIFKTNVILLKQNIRYIKFNQNYYA